MSQFVSCERLTQLQVLGFLQDEQDAIATVFSDMDTEIEAMERRCLGAGQSKQGMMQQLLTSLVPLVESSLQGASR